MEELISSEKETVGTSRTKIRSHTAGIIIFFSDRCNLLPKACITLFQRTCSV